MTKKRILVTSALPYANGSIHIGHLVEYIQTDIFVRFLKLIGKNAIYCCADDTHGTPIEINAAKKGVKPEDFIAKFFKEHKRDFDTYHVNFDSYYTTNSPENKRYVKLIYKRLKQKGLIYTKDLELTYCENCTRFLPDRYVRGTCPNCDAQDQYGDVCESCNTAHKTTDLLNPKCSICKQTPVKKTSKHYFFKLSAFSDKLRDWLNKNKELQPEVRNQVLEWINKGLEDWNISRDPPYFGFKIPGEEDKYFYVWLDAPIGYIASTANYCKNKDITAEDYWQKPGSDIIHFIGKDIIYFHLLFWPAVLMGADFNLPRNVLVHGFLTVNKQKMSKSRGTFLTAQEFAQLTKPEFLRFYYAANLARKMSDVDLDLSDFKDRINNELVANVANFFYRVLSYCNKTFESNIIPAEKSFLDSFDYNDIIKDYNRVEFRSVVKKILKISSKGNKYFQDNEPWALIKTDREKTHQIVSNCVNLVKDITILLKPILPIFTAEIENQLNLKELTTKQLKENLGKHKINKAEILIKKIDPIKLKKFDKFADLDLRIAKIDTVEKHPNADKLYVLKLDIGGEEKQIVSGLRDYYEPEQLLGKKIVLVYNLKPAKLKGIKSEGMLLAADTKQGPKLVLAEKSKSGDKVIVSQIKSNPKDQITIENFKKIKLYAKNNQAWYDKKPLKTSVENLIVPGARDKTRII
ncbi:MAG: Methionine--tRNA ligase [Candidatus Woesearchaeota archaeon]|nr:Methionine--tRNA ligase [Candidatus Woesearchaeota archaeon]